MKDKELFKRTGDVKIEGADSATPGLVRDNLSSTVSRLVNDEKAVPEVYKKGVNAKVRRKSLDENPLGKSTAETKIERKKEKGMDHLNRVAAKTWRSREMKNTYNALLSDYGGIDMVSFAETEILRRISALSVMAMEMEMEFVVDGENFHLDDYVIVARTQLSLIRAIGTKRREKELNDEEPLDLDDYLMQKSNDK